MNDLDQLRESFDGSESFMSGGHQILKARKGRPRSVPEWISNEARFREILLSVFPKMIENERQRKRAGKWTRIFYLYYKGNYTSGDIAEELNITPNTVKLTLYRIRLIASGFQTGGKSRGARGVNPRGRPKQNSETKSENSETIRTASDV